MTIMEQPIDGDMTVPVAAAPEALAPEALPVVPAVDLIKAIEDKVNELEGKLVAINTRLFNLEQFVTRVFK